MGLEYPTPSPSSNTSPSPQVDSPIIQQLHRFPLSALDPELVELLDPYFAIFSHAKAHCSRPKVPTEACSQ